MKYSKNQTSIDEQIALLKNRGLNFSNEASAKKLLSDISYYRLAGYWWPMQQDKVNHIFKNNSTFDDAVRLYNFDRELRLLLFELIECLEISLRSKLIYYLSHEKGPWWFEDSSNFKNPIAHQDCLIAIDRELQQSKEVFIKQHYVKYFTDTRRPPAWKSLEVSSFGTMSKVYSNLLPSIKSKDQIARDFNTANQTFLPSWLLSISQIRNICAHHQRLWNKNLPGKPKLLPKPPAPWLATAPPVTEHHMLYVHICCMKYLLDSTNRELLFTEKLSDLLNRYPNVDLKALGFPANWQTEPLWQS